MRDLRLFIYSPGTKHVGQLERGFGGLLSLAAAGVATVALISAADRGAIEIARALGIALLEDDLRLDLCASLMPLLGKVESLGDVSFRASGRRQLTEREQAILVSLRAVLTLKTIATNLGISTNTVSTYKARIMVKLGYRTNADLLRSDRPHANGSVEPDIGMR